MKRFQQVATFAMAAVLCAGLTVHPAMAAETDANGGLEVTMSTDKDAYEVSDHIVVNVSVKNTNEEAVDNIRVKNDVPAGYEVVEGSSDLIEIDSLLAGEEKTVTSEFVLATTAETPASPADESSDDNDDDHHSSHSSKTTVTTPAATATLTEEEVPLAAGVAEIVAPQEAAVVTVADQDVPLAGAPQTGDHNHMAGWIVVFILSAGACAVMIRKRKEIKKYLALAAIFAIAGTSISVSGLSVHAAEANGMDLSKNITVAGQAVELTSHVYVEVEFIGGTVVNALNNNKLKDVTVKLRAGSDNHEGEYVEDAQGQELVMMTNASGYYEFLNLEAGNYTAEFEKEGYITGYKNVVCAITSGHNDMALSPNLSGDEYRVTLTWGANPSDLDSHLEFTDTQDHHHIYYNHKNYEVDSITMANLDWDETSGYGPETVTFRKQEGVTFTYYVKDYSNKYNEVNEKLSASGASIHVYCGDQQVAEYQIPTGQIGIYWTVFTIDDDGIHTVDKVGNNINDEFDEGEVVSLELEAELLTETVTEEVATEEVTTEEATTEEAVEETSEDISEGTAGEVTSEEITEEATEETTGEISEETSEEAAGEAASEETTEEAEEVSEAEESVEEI